MRRQWESVAIYVWEKGFLAHERRAWQFFFLVDETVSRAAYKSCTLFRVATLSYHNYERSEILILTARLKLGCASFFAEFRGVILTYHSSNGESHLTKSNKKVVPLYPLILWEKRRALCAFFGERRQRGCLLLYFVVTFDVFLFCFLASQVATYHVYGVFPQGDPKDGLRFLVIVNHCCCLFVSMAGHPFLQHTHGIILAHEP